MPRLFHAKAATEYHSWEKCPSALRIPAYMQEEGTGGLEPCPVCADQNLRNAEP
jgi:hypothetical protein